MRSQMFAKSLQMQLVVGALKRLDMLRTMPELKEKLYSDAEDLVALQGKSVTGKMAKLDLIGIDTDEDGMPDGCDACPNDSDNDIDQDGICGDVDD